MMVEKASAMIGGWVGRWYIRGSARLVTGEEEGGMAKNQAGGDDGRAETGGARSIPSMG